MLKRKRQSSWEATGAIQPRQPPAPVHQSTDDESEPEQLKEIAPETITIAVFCALPYEVIAVIHCLDEEFACRPTTLGSQKYIYTFGRIGSHKIVIARPHQTGTVDAAHCATAVNQQFPNVKFALMVGIGAGIPNLPKVDIRLGDIVVSIPQNNHPGVIQYDFGKYEENGFVLKGSLDKPPPILISADGSLQHDEGLGRCPLKKILRHITRKPGFGRPDIEDILFDKSFSHVNEGDDCHMCETMGGNKLAREVRNRPMVHRGLILSGSGVIKNPSDRERLCRGYKDALCYEIGAAGIMDEIPCLVIRGICDYADTHKQVGWHYYAAAVAAAYCKAILCKVDSQSINLDTVGNLDQTIDMSKLPIAEGAYFDSYDDQHEPECLEGTRTELLQDIGDWVNNPEAKFIFWLSGMAGTGKSTVSRTVAKTLAGKGSLGASFFFKRGEGHRGNTKRFFPTVIRQLINNIPQLILGVRESLKNDPDIASKSLPEQFNKLLLRPLLAVTQSNLQPAPIIIVADALDECDQDKDIRIILHLLPEVLKSKFIHLRFFLTSRNEYHIQQSFKDIVSMHQNLVLHQIPESMLERDMTLYFEYEFSKMRRQHSFPPDWPGSQTIKTLVLRAMPLFISAAKLCRFIGNTKWVTEKRLKAILADQTMYASKFKSTYVPVLNQLLVDQDEWESQQSIDEFKNIVGVIIVVADPLSIHALSQLLCIEADDIQNRLDLFHSVLNVPKDLDTPVKLLHASFRDFLLDSKIKDSNPFWIDEKKVHDRLTMQCLIVMSHNLRRNICFLPEDNTERENIDARSIARCIKAEVQYSCRYWTHHLMQGSDPSSLLEDAFSILRDHILHWMEAMSILGLMSEAVIMVNTLNSLTAENQNPEISAFLYDARLFILKNRHLAEIAPLQLYSSALIFTPKTSVIRRGFEEQELPSWIYTYPRFTLEGHKESVTSMAFSSDEKLLASGSRDMTIQVWDTTTGAWQRTLRGHTDAICSVAFSPLLLASSSNDKTIKLWEIADGLIRLWDTITKDLKHEFRGHKGSIKPATISPCGRLLASICNDGTVNVWDICTGYLQRTVQGCLAIIFSLDNGLLALPMTLALEQAIYNQSVISVAFLKDERTLVSASIDGIVTIWDTNTRILQQNAENHGGLIPSMEFSFDGRLLASASWDKTVKLWDTETGKAITTFSGHGDIVLVGGVFFR
ncbi:G-protein beta WD-40 repeats containing protein, putative [Talaromyces stipitatus ATCC 10500]|uniref:G-protein beta WD-40 repeats containing protein, putative n=1 Tax=Talaromyces stipitatus (strain ATCC 10500 / CBS 375.48 / QM 6759 / NRRL 1006) TaxID=441959 RepID=B8LY76_TALSN|nr:G-protein beta WD-40 repeats containing protein, putative [Talaromyces stipitatus ATCC 10500]EED23321.1 G-protein beta WD-40 repeats containing protein, putative [Talaromyces stipitatus ATCC 10500]